MVAFGADEICADNGTTMAVDSGDVETCTLPDASVLDTTAAGTALEVVMVDPCALVVVIGTTTDADALVTKPVVVVGVGLPAALVVVVVPGTIKAV